MLEHCMYCRKVMDFMEEYNISYEKIDISDEANERELISLGGKRQVPYMVDEEGGVQMYESLDIIEYLSKKIAQ
jgi:glutathione S-transferase